jgi:hypothetical protein
MPPDLYGYNDKAMACGLKPRTAFPQKKKKQCQEPNEMIILLIKRLQS